MKVGTVIENKYEILKLIGKGGMSKVYLAMDQNLKKQWAVKEIEKKEIMLQSALAEANMMKKLDHPNLPRIVDIIDGNDVIYVVMDYIEGEPLSDVLSKRGAQPQETVMQWAKELCGVLTYLHTQTPPIIYRDMKPANVMLQPNGTVKLIDFGIAREYKEQNLADTVSLGTKGYAAPEQFGGIGQTDARTDIYCLGVTLYHLLTGQNPCEPPYEIYPIRYWNPGLSSGLESILLKCTQLNPNDRYQSCAELLHDLNRYQKLDESYRRRQLKKRNLFTGTVLLSCLFLTLGSYFQIQIRNVNNHDYNNHILQAEKSVTVEEQIHCYTKAMDIKPDELKAYFGLIDAFKDDATFSVSEEQILKQYLNVNLTALQENDEYGKLAFEVGKLYWYYYDYGKNEATDNRVTRMKSAMQWFDDACVYGGEESEYYLMARIYRDIGRFNRDITLNVEEATDKGTYAPYWENLNTLAGIIENSKEDKEIVNLEGYRLIVSAIETYARKFKADEVTKESMEALLQTVKTGIKNTATTTDKTEQMKEEIRGRIDFAKTAIDNAFTDK